MSNNKQKMKLYTEEEVRSMIMSMGQFIDEQIDYYIDELTPIELPSDEEIENYARQSGLLHPFVSIGAEWMRNKIQGGNK